MTRGLKFRPLLVALCLLMGGAEALAAERFGQNGTEITGKFRAVIVWVQDYQAWSPLSAPKKDALRVAKLLTERYLFAPEHVEVVGNPTQAELFSTIKRAAVSAEPGDSLLVFFAGHGYLEKASGHGYWVPRDAKAPGEAAELSYLSSGWIRDVMKGSKARHVAVVSDSCFSGALLQSRSARPAITDTYYAKMYQRRSFEGLTSGALETVDDASGPNGHSPFAYYFIQALEKADGPVFDLHDIYQRVRTGVKSLSSQTPMFGRLQGAPSDGGSFVFVARTAVTEGAKKAKAAVPPTPAGDKANTKTAKIGNADPKTVDAWSQANQAYGEKRYSEALKLGLRHNFCDMGHVRGCAMMARIYRDGLGTMKDPEQAATYERDAVALASPGCDKGDAESCFVLGRARQGGRVVATDLPAAARTFQRGCDLGHGAACGVLASMLHTGSGVSENAPKSVELFYKGCVAGDGPSCFYAARAFYNGEGVATSIGQAFTLFKEACEAGYLDGCGWQGLLTASGRGTKADRKTGLSTMAYACKQGSDTACLQIGSILVEGRFGVKKNAKTGLETLAATCNRGDSRACTAAGRYLYEGKHVRRDITTAGRWLLLACQTNDADACFMIGRILEGGEGAYDEDIDKATNYYGRSCQLGSDTGCKALAELEGPGPTED